MDAILDSIRIAMADGASDSERARGALACRALADVLDGVIVPAEAPSADPPHAHASAAEPTSTEAPAATAAPVLDPVTALVAPPVMASPLAGNPFAGLTADQILELTIAKLRASAGDEPLPPPLGSPFRLTLVPVPPRRP